MAALSTSITSIAIANISSTGLPQPQRSSSLAFFPHKVSKVCFTTRATKKPDNDLQASIAAGLDDVAKKTVEAIEDSREKGNEINEELKEAKETSDSAAEKAKENTDAAFGEAIGTADKIKDILLGGGAKSDDKEDA